MIELGSLFMLLLLLFLALVDPVAVAGQAAMSLLAGISVLVISLCLWRSRRGGAEWHPVPGLLPLALLTGFFFLQVLPLPPVLLRLVSPGAWHAYAETVWVVRPGCWMPISLAPEATWVSFFRFMVGVAVYVASIQVLATRERVKRVLPFFALCAGGTALLGTALYLSPLGRNDGLPGEHFAVLMAMVLPVIIAQYLVSRPQVSYLPFRQKVARFLRRPGAYPHMLQGASFLLPLFGIFLVGSRGGLFGAATGLLVFLLLLLTRSRGRKGEVWGVLALPLLMLLVGTALFVGGDQEERNATASDGEGQIVRPLAQNAAVGPHDFALWGTGAGTFADVARRHRTGPDAAGQGGEKSGNTYLQFGVEGGAVGVALLTWFLLAALWQTLPAWRRRHGRMPVYLSPGAFAGMAAFLVAGWVEGGLHESGIVLSFFFCMGLGVSAATGSTRPAVPREAPADKPSPFVAAWMLPLLLAMLFHAGLVVASLATRSSGHSLAGDMLVPRGVALAARFAPFEAGYRYLLADGDLARGDVEGALERFVAALRLRPLNPEYLQRLGLVFGNLGEDDKAKRLLISGVASDPSNPERQRAIAYWLLAKGRGGEALEHVRSAIYLEPEKTWDFLALMADHGLSDEEMRRAMPERSLSLLAYGDFLMAAGKESAAEESFLEAVRYAMMEPRPSPVPFQRVADIYSRRGEAEAALEAVLAGVEVLPKNVQLRFRAAALYERLGVTYRAIEEYRGVLALEPGNGTARARLRELGVSM